MIPVSSMSVTARYLRQVLAENIEDVEVENIYISNPKDMTNDPTLQSINLFFYRVDCSGYPADVTSDNPVYVRMYCLITALGADETVGDGENEETIMAGENDLRIIGEIIHILHENPIISLEGDGYPLHLQAVFTPMNLDDLNHLWVTQGNTENAYRLSVAYEFSLAPVPLTTPVLRAPRVGDLGLDVEKGMQNKSVTDIAYAARRGTSEVGLVNINTHQANWSPHICFIDMAQQTLSYVLRRQDDALPANIDILVAGADGTQLRMEWETWEWNYDDNTGGWSGPVDDSLSPQVDLPEDNEPGNPFRSNIIDPDNIDMRQHFQVSLPFNTPPPENIRRQAMLYATYEFERPRPGGITEVVQMRSNGLLVSFYSEGAA